jgi:DNA-binding YbaB/EbfC family protein
MNMDFGNMAKAVREMQKKMEKLEEDLKERVVEAQAGGAVTVKANGKREILDIKIDAEIISKEEKKMLEDLVVAACNLALEKAAKMREQEYARVVGFSPGAMPGLF